ncbi:hypothetical protein MYX78_06345 [Acidobacteria bacterium AH-259-G07]|nr:hypothetical protein [Acidobacteria bacterium AH-259-G07]
MDEFFPNEGTPRYHYYLRLDLKTHSQATQVGLDWLRIENDLQMAPLSLPALDLGDNTIAYRDDTRDPHQVYLSFSWVESSASRAPLPPTAPVFPSDGEQVEGTQFTSQWEDAQDPDADAIADYHFRLSAESGMRWVFSSNFDKLISNTANRGSLRYTIPYPGLLNPGQRYYWRVRARDEKGVWSDWSQAWSFVPQGPGVPLNVRLQESGDGSFILNWELNPGGRKPSGFRIYASNEKGFSVSDEPYEVNVGSQHGTNQKVMFPSNFLATTLQSSFPIRPQHAFYRVVAVDEQGNRSGPSDYAAAPRPFIHSEPPIEAKVGVEYRYEVESIYSIGALKCRIQKDDLYHDTYCEAAFWDKDKPKFSLVDESPICGYRDPAWLRIDPENGLLIVTPREEDIDEYQVNVLVEIERSGQELQSFVLKVVP